MIDLVGEFYAQSESVKGTEVVGSKGSKRWLDDYFSNKERFGKRDMKKVIIMVVFMLVMICGSCFAGQRYELYPTDNINTVLKLDTSNGKVWQVHIAVGSDAVRAQHEVNYLSLTDNPFNGRFVLQKTGNMYNFVLCDTEDGRCWQLQWSFKPENRGILPIL